MTRNPTDTIEACYAAAADASLWPQVLDRFAREVGCRGAVIVSHDPSRTARTIESACLADVSADYAGGWWQRDTRIARARALRLPPGSVTSDEMMFSHGETRRDPFFQEFFRGHGLGNLGAYFDADPGDGSIFTLSAPRDLARGTFEADEIERLRLIGPHLTRAFRLHQLIEATRGRSADIALALEALPTGVLVLDAQGRLTFANAAAERLCAGYVRLKPGEPPASASAQEDGRIAALVRTLPPRSEPAPNPIFLRGERTGRPISIEAMPTVGEGRAGGALLLVRDPFAPVRATLVPQLAQLGLTPAEARSAMLVGRGLSPREAAQDLGIAESTVRHQLKVVFSKLGLRRQSELAVLVTRLDTAAGP